MANIYVNDIIKRAQDQEHGYVVEAKNVTGIKAYAFEENIPIPVTEITGIKSYAYNAGEKIPFNEVTGIQSYIENFVKYNIEIKVNGSTEQVEKSYEGNKVIFNINIKEPVNPPTETYYWYVGFDSSIENDGPLNEAKLQALGSASTKAGYSTSYTSWPSDVQITTQSGYCYIVAPKSWIDGYTKFMKNAGNVSPTFYNLKEDQSTLGFNPEFTINDITYSIYCSQGRMAAGAILTTHTPTN